VGAESAVNPTVRAARIRRSSHARSARRWPARTSSRRTWTPSAAPRAFAWRS